MASTAPPPWPPAPTRRPASTSCARLCRWATRSWRRCLWRPVWTWPTTTLTGSQASRTWAPPASPPLPWRPPTAPAVAYASTWRRAPAAPHPPRAPGRPPQLDEMQALDLSALPDIPPAAPAGDLKPAQSPEATRRGEGSAEGVAPTGGGGVAGTFRAAG